MLALAATCLMVALAAPTAGAAGAKSDGPVAKAAVSKKKLAKDIKKVNRRANSARRGVKKLNVDLTKLGADLRAAITGGDKTVDDKINGIVGVVTPILQQLGQGSLDLKAGLEKLAAATTEGFAVVKTNLETAGAALTDIGDFLGATEYGFGQVIVVEGGTTQNPQEGHFVVTPDLPDTVQQGMTEQSFEADVVNPGPVAVAYGIRTGENDGDEPGHCRVTVTDEDGNVDSTDAGPFGIGFLPVDNGSALTSTDPDNVGFPFGLKTDDAGADEEDKFATFVSSIVVADGESYSVALSCVDTTPDAEDPEA